MDNATSPAPDNLQVVINCNEKESDSLSFEELEKILTQDKKRKIDLMYKNIWYDQRTTIPRFFEKRLS